MGCHFLLQVIFPIQASNLHLSHWQADYLSLSHPGRPSIKWGSNFIILHVINQLPQHHLLKRAPFPTECLWLLGMIKMLLLQRQSCFWVGPKVRSDFSITSYGKTQRNFSGQTNIIQHINISKQHGVHLKMYPMLCINIYCS